MIYSAIDVSLEGLELVISGAVPDFEDWTEPTQDRAILEFVSIISGIVIKYGGRIIHGTHPTFTPVVLHQAELHGVKGQRPPVTIFMSELWWSRTLPFEKERFASKAVELVITPQPLAGEPEVAEIRDAALTVMREAMIMQANSLVAIGGKFHKNSGFAPGVTEELNLALRMGAACFLVGAFGGKVSEIAKTATPENLNNQLGKECNRELMTSGDITSTINIIFRHLAHNPEVFRFKAR